MPKRFPGIFPFNLKYAVANSMEKCCSEQYGNILDSNLIFQFNGYRTVEMIKHRANAYWYLLVQSRPL